MARTDWFILIAGALAITGFSLIVKPAHADCKLCTNYVCTLVVNGHNVSWPPMTLSKSECEGMAEVIAEKDETDAEIECSCTVGGQA